MVLARSVDAALQAFETRVASPEMVQRAARAVDAARERGVARDIVGDIQARRLRQTVAHVAERSPFYRKLFQRVRVSPSSVGSPDDLRRLPFTTADDIRDARRFLCVGEDELAAVFTSAGSTGEPKQVYYTLPELERITNLSALALRVQHRGRLHALIALPMQHGLWIGSAMARNIIRRAGGLPLPVGAGDPEETLAWMRRLEPNVVVSSPSYMTVLTQAARKGGYRRELDRIVLGGEMLREEQRAALEGYWGGRILDSYGTTEIGGAQTISLPGCHGFHLNDFHLVTEIVDPQTGEPAEEGELVFTTIRREAMPLLRYRSGDRARWVDCPDRIPLAAVKLLGRVDDLIVAGDLNLYGSVIADAVTDIPGAGRRVRLRVSTVDLVDHLAVDVEGDEVSEDSVRKGLFSVYPEARASVESGQLVVEIATGVDLSDQIKALKIVDRRGE